MGRPGQQDASVLTVVHVGKQALDSSTAWPTDTECGEVTANPEKDEVSTSKREGGNSSVLKKE